MSLYYLSPVDEGVSELVQVLNGFGEFGLLDGHCQLKVAELLDDAEVNGVFTSFLVLLLLFAFSFLTFCDTESCLLLGVGGLDLAFG